MANKDHPIAQSHQTAPHSKLRRMWLTLLAIVCLAAICVVVLVRRDESGVPQAANNQAPAATPQPESVTFAADAAGFVELPQLGLRIKAKPELTQQGLVGVISADSPDYTKRIAFTTEELRRDNKNCDGTNGSLAVLTRYEGSSTEMSEHQHGSTSLDFPDFHISYQTTTETPCTITSREAYDPLELKKETEAARNLWDAMLTAEPL